MNPLKVFVYIAAFGALAYTGGVILLLAAVAITRIWRRPYQLHNRRNP